MKSSATTMAENHKNMKYCNTLFEILVADMVDVSIEGSENKCMRDDSPLSNIRQRKGKQVKKTSKGKFKASVKKDNFTKEMADSSHRKGESYKRKLLLLSNQPRHRYLLQRGMSMTTQKANNELSTIYIYRRF